MIDGLLPKTKKPDIRRRAIRQVRQLPYVGGLTTE